MPVYEYACKACGHHMEVSQSFKDAALTECPACGGPLRKVFGSIGIVLKGSGFYRTDSRLPAKKEKEKEKAGKADAGGDKPAATEAKPTGDAKPAAAASSDAKPSSSSSGAAKTA
ncbi:MAG: FmdB family zinc ribbon protein [Acidimicrobiia bacterium]